MQQVPPARTIGRVGQVGFTMTEILVAVFVLSLGMLGLGALQVTATRSSQSSYYRTQATLMAVDMLERMRVNVLESRSGSYDIVFADASPGPELCVGPARNCSSIEISRFDLDEWLNRLAAELPQGDGQIVTTEDTSFVPSTYTVAITVQWFDQTDATTVQYNLTSRL